MAAPGVADQAEVVAHQLVPRPQRPPAHRVRGVIRSSGVLLPAVVAAGELEHRPLRERLVAAAGIQPGSHRGGCAALGVHRGMVGGSCRWERLGHGDGSPGVIGCVMAAIVPIAIHTGKGGGL